MHEKRVTKAFRKLDSKLTEEEEEEMEKERKFQHRKKLNANLYSTF